jgi:hypothetical protein
MRPEYRSAREFVTLRGYTRWDNIEVAIKCAKTDCEQVGQIVDHQFPDATTMIQAMVIAYLRRTSTTLTMVYRRTVARILDLQSDSRITFRPATVAIMHINKRIR